jgi:hypothetical protein
MRLICSTEDSNQLSNLMNKYLNREKYLEVYYLEVHEVVVGGSLVDDSIIKKVSCIKVRGVSELLLYNENSEGTRYIYEHDGNFYKELLNWYKFRNRSNKLDDLGI